MRRASRSIQLVLITSTALWYSGCDRQSSQSVDPNEMVWVDDGNGNGHWAPTTRPSGYYSGSGYRSNSSTYHSSHWYSNSSSSSSGSGSSSHSSSSGTSHGGFGSSGHAAASHGGGGS